MALTFISQSVTSAIIDNFVETGFTYLKAFPAASGMQDELKRLQVALPQVEAVLTAVEECAPAMMQNKGLDRWLWQLRDAVEDAEDVLDELEYYELEKIIRDRDDKVRGNILSKCKTKIDSFINRIFSDDTLKRLREAVKGLDRVVASIGPFLQIATGIYGHNVKRQKLEEVKNARETSSLLIESEVFGRNKERDTIVEWLIKPVDGESEGITFNVSAYTIVGMGGLGKTTLAQLIHQDERVQTYFDLIMWVCVSQDFNAAAITKNILEEINHKSSDHMQSLNALHKELKEKLTPKRFLLILDDVWNDNNMSEWEKLVAPLKFGQRGSKILLTTRMGSVADMAATVMQYKRESLDLNDLEERDCMSLFNKHAFLGVNPNDYKNLQPIGEQIVKKLGGCPLAIKVMGGLLNSYMNYDYWKRILKEDATTVLQEKNDITTVLRLSYDHLPVYLQVCFRYCSIFPKNYTFRRESLVYIWMGSGLISQSINESRRPEDIGEEYFNILIRKSFFTIKTSDSSDGTNYFVMHDLLHDLAKSVSEGECIRIEGDVAGNIIPKTVRHLYFENINLLSIGEIPNLKNLRTLVISDKEEHIFDKEKHEHNADHLREFNKVIKGFKNLRLLSMSGSFDFYKMGDALDRSVHLRYLSLLSGKATIESITEFLRLSVYRLYHLQFLKLFYNNITNPAATDIIEWDGLTNLVNLRSLIVPDYVSRKIPYVSKLSFICQLYGFFVRDKSGYKISELKNLSDLRDHLSIRGLENVRISEEAMEAKLNEKEYLESLTLVWSKGRSNSVEMDEQLLDNLCPHINLKKLCIEEYQGVNSPRWMSDLSFLNNLTSIKLMYCKGWEHLPPLGRLPSLNDLELRGLHAVKKIDSSFFGSSGGGCAFPSLKELVFFNLSNLEEFIGIDDGCMFPQLQTLKIFGCPNLSVLPPMFPKLQTLDISGCPNLSVLPPMFPKLQTMNIYRCPNLSVLPTLPRSLKRLDIFKVGLTALQVINQDWGNNNQEYFKALENICIQQCEKLECVPPEFFSKSNPLRYLGIVKCPKLTMRGISDIQLPSTLNAISIGSCGDLEVPLLQFLPNLASFTSLKLCDCASVASLPTAQVCARWTMLFNLRIENCKELSSLGGIQALVSLRWLLIRGCDKLIEVARLEAPFPNDVGQENAADCLFKLSELSIDHHALLLMEPLRSLSSISKFILFNASQLTSLPEEWLLQNHSALKKLYIWNAVSLQSLPQSMTQLCSLESLEVGNAKLIQSLPDLPTSLRSLWITGCHPELKERCQRNIGLVWPKIANIPKVDVRIELKFPEVTMHILYLLHYPSSFPCYPLQLMQFISVLIKYISFYVISFVTVLLVSLFWTIREQPGTIFNLAFSKEFLFLFFIVCPYIMILDT